AERADPRRVAGGVLLEIVADIPDGAVVRRLHRVRRVCLPASRLARRGALRVRPFREDRLLHGELSQGIARLPAGESLSGEGLLTAQRVADGDAERLFDS